MKKNNVKTSAKKQSKKVASNARRKRRTAARDLVVQRKVRPLLKHIEGLEKQVKGLMDQLSIAPQADAVIRENQELMTDLAQGGT